MEYYKGIFIIFMRQSHANLSEACDPVLNCGFSWKGGVNRFRKTRVFFRPKRQMWRRRSTGCSLINVRHIERLKVIKSDQNGQFLNVLWKAHNLTYLKNQPFWQLSIIFKVILTNNKMSKPRQAPNIGNIVLSQKMKT